MKWKILLTLVVAILIYIFLSVSAQGFEQFESVKYLLLIIIPILIYVAIKDLFM